MTTKRIVRRDRTGRAEARALEDALDPIEDAHLEAKDTYLDAVASYREAVAAAGDQADQDAAVAAALKALREAKQVKVAAASQYEETRTWLRREAAIATLSTRTIPELTRKLAAPILVKDGASDARDDAEERARLEQLLVAARQELAATIEEALPLRRALEQLGGRPAGDLVPPDLPPGSAEVTAPTIAVSTTVNRRKGGN
ncbi:hypothetical protein [Nonomuraea dietziae]|uniref:hypothetical protein n=1 Tax=Nonomuraea dietziae TaxID=65515 RepID=UPI003401A4C1